jgi:lipopolysaccharide/colanic/teichoic acid biosynthesis glycosyltransferase
VTIVRNLIRVAAATLLLVMLLPLLLAIVVTILLDDGGPILFRQTRLAQDGRTFTLYKFRKFRAACPANGRPVTLHNDDRLTRVGRVLEQSKLDELPQIWNVLKGDMALVGPRPESLAFADCFRGRYRELLRYRPGIFGPAQAIFRNEGALYPDGEDPEAFYRDVLFPAKARIDLAYYPTRSWGADMGWLLYCVGAVLDLVEPPGEIAEICTLGGRPQGARWRMGKEH